MKVYWASGAAVTVLGLGLLWAAEEPPSPGEIIAAAVTEEGTGSVELGDRVGITEELPPKSVRGGVADREDMIALRVGRRKLWCPRSTTRISVSDSGTVMLDSAGAHLALFVVGEGETGGMLRHTIKDMPSEFIERHFERIVTGLEQAGLSEADAARAMAAARKELLALTDEELLLRALGEDSTTLLAEEDPQAAALRAALHIARSSSWGPWGTGMRFHRRNGSTVYLVPSKQGFMQTYAVLEYDRDGILVADGILGIREGTVEDPIRLFVAIYGVPEKAPDAADGGETETPTSRPVERSGPAE